MPPTALVRRLVTWRKTNAKLSNSAATSPPAFCDTAPCFAHRLMASYHPASDPETRFADICAAVHDLIGLCPHAIGDDGSGSGN